MDLRDSNIWIALAIEAHAHHRSAVAWFGTVDAPASVLFCRSTQQSFLRLLTTRAVCAPYGLEAMTNEQAWRMFEALMADHRVVLRGDEPPGLGRQWRAYSGSSVPSPKLWMDAYLAAYAQAGGHRLVTIDAAFSAFPGLDLLVLS